MSLLRQIALNLTTFLPARQAVRSATEDGRLGVLPYSA